MNNSNPPKLTWFNIAQDSHWSLRVWNAEIMGESFDVSQGIALVDSGTTKLIIPPAPFKRLKDHALRYPDCQMHRAELLCPCELAESLPHIQFVMGDGEQQLRFYIEGKDYLQPVKYKSMELPGCGVQVGTIEGHSLVLLGLPFFRAYHVMFDLASTTLAVRGELGQLGSQEKKAVVTVSAG